MQAAKYGIREFSQMKVLVINAGSSSLKYQLLDTASGEVMAKGLCERIGIDGVLTHTGNKSDEKFKFDIAMPTHKEAIQSVINVLLDPEKGVISSMSEIDAVGHRVVHGGEFFSDSVIITEKVIKAIEDCVPLAPLHNPPNLTGIEACREVMGPDVPMVAVFDTAFHQTMPQSHYMYAVPYLMFVSGCSSNEGDGLPVRPSQRWTSPPAVSGTTCMRPCAERLLIRSGSKSLSV